MSINQVANTLRDHPNGCTLAVRIQPGAKKTAITGIYGEGDSAALKVAVQAPPIEGRANDSLVAFFAELFGLPRSAVVISHGKASRSKLVALQGMTAVESQAKLRATLEKLLSN
jgi:uncharacterized protein (TIGR00251 family)